MMKNNGIRNKLLISYFIVFILSFSLGSAYIYYSVRQTISANIEKEMKQSAEAVLGMVKTAAAVSIKNHLRAVSEKNLEMVRHLYKRFRQGLMSEAQDRQLSADLFLDQTIGQSGYNYCIDSRGTVKVHPSKALVGTNVSQYEFVRRQIKLKSGYLEYDWKNAEESTAGRFPEIRFEVVLYAGSRRLHVPNVWAAANDTGGGSRRPGYE